MTDEKKTSDFLIYAYGNVKDLRVFEEWIATLRKRDLEKNGGVSKWRDSPTLTEMRLYNLRCHPEDSERLREALSGFTNELQHQTIFSKLFKIGSMILRSLSWNWRKSKRVKTTLNVHGVSDEVFKAGLTWVGVGMLAEKGDVYEWDKE